MITTLSAKDPDETISVGAEFAELMADGETLTTATVAITVLRGTDPGAAAMLVGAASASGSVAAQLVGSGVAGVDYQITFTANTSMSQVLKLVGVLPVRVQA